MVSFLLFTRDERLRRTILILMTSLCGFFASRPCPLRMPPKQLTGNPPPPTPIQPVMMGLFSCACSYAAPPPPLHLYCASGRRNMRNDMAVRMNNRIVACSPLGRNAMFIAAAPLSCLSSEKTTHSPSLALHFYTFMLLGTVFCRVCTWLLVS